MHPLQLMFPCFLAVVLVALPAPVEACAPAPPRNVVVEIASESAIIVWDSAAKTQHFIRRAAFAANAAGDAKVQDFGFLVPTPNVPVLEEVADAAFDELAKVTAPKTETRQRAGGGCGIGCGAAKSPAGGSTVEVLQEKHVAGYDAKVLRASDTAALQAWLKQHEYEARPALMRWVKPYVDKGWVITAFKIARDKDASTGLAVGSAAVRMSFKTDAPFFPYSEPDDLKDAKTRRLLRVFFLGDRKMLGVRGDADWETKIAWAGKLAAEGAKALAPLLKIPGYEPTEDTWLTEFEDHASPRPGGLDVTFKQNPDQNPVERPARIVYTARSDPAGRAGFALFVAAVAGVYLLQRLAPRRTRA